MIAVDTSPAAFNAQGLPPPIPQQPLRSALRSNARAGNATRRVGFSQGQGQQGGAAPPPNANVRINVIKREN